MKHEDAIQQLAARFAEESIGSIDHGVNARAIALRDAKVRAQIAERLTAGHQLTGVRALAGYASRTDEFPVLFEFRQSSGDAPIDLDARSVCVYVNIPAQTVVAIDSGDRARAGVDSGPFVVAAPSRTYDAVMNPSRHAGSGDVARGFLRSTGIAEYAGARLGASGIAEGENTIWDTAYDTNHSVTTEWESNYGVTDFKQDNEPTLDYKIDKKNDPTSAEGLFGLPLDGPIIILPNRPGRTPRPEPDPAPNRGGRRS